MISHPFLCKQCSIQIVNCDRHRQGASVFSSVSFFWPQTVLGVQFGFPSGPKMTHSGNWLQGERHTLLSWYKLDTIRVGIENLQHMPACYTGHRVGIQGSPSVMCQFPCWGNKICTNLLHDPQTVSFPTNHSPSLLLWQAAPCVFVWVCSTNCSNYYGEITTTITGNAVD